MIGIYFLLDRKKVVYIGQSKRIANRLSGHKDKEFDSVRIIKCDEKKLNEYESRLIALFNPKYNKTLKNINKLKANTIALKLDDETRKMLERMATKNQRSIYNQIHFAIKQAYRRQFQKSQYDPNIF